MQRRREISSAVEFRFLALFHSVWATWRGV
jgi:hypothetical protein